MAQSALQVYDVTQQSGANDRDRIQNAIDDAEKAGGGTVYFPAGTYTVNITSVPTEISLASDVSLEFASGAIIDFSGSNAGRVLFKAEGSEGSPVALTANASEGDTFVTIASGSLAGFPRGAIVRIGSTKKYAPKEENQEIGELNYVDVPQLITAVDTVATSLEVDNTDSLLATGTILIGTEEMSYAKETSPAVAGVVKLNVTRGVNGTTADSHPVGAGISLLPLGRLLMPLPLQGGPYDTASSAAVSLITPCRNVRIDGGRLIGGGPGDNQVGIRLDRTIHARIASTEFDDVDGMAIAVNDSIDALIDGVSVLNTRRQTAAGAASGYGVGLTYANQDCTIRNSFFRRCRHATSVGAAADRYGVPRRITFAGNHITETTGTAMDLHAPCTPSMLFSGNQIYDCRGAFNIYNNGAVIVDNIVTRCQTGVNYGNKTDYPAELDIRGNTFTECSGDALVVGSAPEGVGDIRHLTIVNNLIFRPGGWGIYLFSLLGWAIEKAVLIGNVVTAGSGTDGGIRVVQAAGCVISNNVVSDVPANLPAIKVENTAKSAVGANVIGYVSLGTGKAIQVIDGDDLAITGNVARSAGVGISVESSNPPTATSDACVLTGNNVRGCTTPIALAGNNHIAKAGDTVSEAFNRE